MKNKRIHDKAIENYYNILRDTDTVFGKPRIFNIPLMGGKCLVFGPSADGDHVYIYGAGNTFAVSYCQTLQFFDESREMLTELMEKAEKQLLPGSNTLSRAMYGQTLIADLYDFMDGKGAKFDSVPENLGALYGIEGVGEESGRLIFEDLSKNPVYIISGSPKERIRIDTPSGEAVFTLDFSDTECTVKRGDEVFLRFTRHGSADALETADGIITASDLHDIIGKSTLIYLNGEPIGTICRELNAGFIEIISHAHAIHVRKPEHTELVALMAVVLTGIM